MSTLVLTRDRIGDLRAGDRIVGIDGRATSMLVMAGLDAGGPGVRLDPERPTVIDWYLYPDSHVADHVRVERPDPPRRQRVVRPARRTVDGVTFVSDGKGLWTTEDGRFAVHKDFAGYTECQHPHPVRLTPAMIEHAEAAGYTVSWAQPIITAARMGERGYWCPGFADHQNPDEWIAVDLRAQEVVGGEWYGYPTFKEAAADAAAAHKQAHEEGQ